MIDDQNDFLVLLSYLFPNELLSDMKAGKGSDILFIDVEMPKVGGFELARKIQIINENVVIIFVTAHEEFGLEGYKYHACYIIQGSKEFRRIFYKNIYYIHIDGKYTYLHTRQGSFSVRKSLNTVFQ